MTAITVEQAQAARPAQNFVVVVFDGVSMGIMSFAFGVFDMAKHYGVLPDLELRSEVGGAIQNPTPADPLVPAGTTNIWLRLKKAGTTYSGEYSFDGTTWTSMSLGVPATL